MKPSPKAVRRILFSVLSLFLLAGIGAVSSVEAQTILVNSANPSSAAQGTVNLNVLVDGQGFKKGATSQWFVTGTTNPGGVTVNSTAFVNSNQLVANINVAQNATISKFDIVVKNTNGRTGKGTELFAVTAPDPAIAFIAWYQNDNRDLVVMNADGSNMLTVLSQAQDSNGHNGPVWSPDGTQLAFSGFNRHTNSSAIYIVNKDGSALRKVIDYNFVNSYGSKIGWSPMPLGDGKYKIAFSDRARLPDGTLQGNNDIFMVNLDGTGLVQLTNTPDENEGDVSWSPQADRLVVSAYNFVINNGLGNLPVYRVNYGPSGFTATFLIDLMTVPASPLKGDFASPAWAKTLDKIAVAAPLTPGAGYYKIWVIDLANPANPVDLTPIPNTFSIGPSWSPDDSRIVFLQNYASGPYGFWVINSDGSAATEIAAPQDTFSYNNPDWRRNP